MLYKQIYMLGGLVNKLMHMKAMEAGSLRAVIESRVIIIELHEPLSVLDSMMPR